MSAVFTVTRTPCGKEFWSTSMRRQTHPQMPAHQFSASQSVKRQRRGVQEVLLGVPDIEMREVTPDAPYVVDLRIWVVRAVGIAVDEFRHAQIPHEPGLACVVQVRPKEFPRLGERA